MPHLSSFNSDYSEDIMTAFVGQLYGDQYPEALADVLQQTPMRYSNNLSLVAVINEN